LSETELNKFTGNPYKGLFRASKCGYTGFNENLMERIPLCEGMKEFQQF